jgi:UDP-glucuronate decarboxylase
LECLEQALADDFGARVLAFGSHARRELTRAGRPIDIKPLSALRAMPRVRTMLLHYAFLTKDRLANLAGDEYFKQSEQLAESVLDAIGRIGVVKMAFPSSGAVYGLPTRPDRSTLHDPEQNPYGTQKLLEEDRFRQVCAEHHTRLIVPRIFSLSGPFINKPAAYALASIINSALENRDIQIRARKRVIRSYIAVRDLVELLVGWLLQSDVDEEITFDTGGEPVEIGELAARVLTALGKTGLSVQRPDSDGSPDDYYCGDEGQFQAVVAGLQLDPACLQQQIRDTAGYLKTLR